MKTEAKKVFLYVRSQGDNISVEVSSSEFETTYCSDICRIVSAPLTEMEIQVPILNNDEVHKVLTGAMLESLIAEREKLQAETHKKMHRLDQRIADLQCLEFKG